MVAKDYKQRSNRQRSPKRRPKPTTSSGGWKSFVVGVGFGIIGTVGVFSIDSSTFDLDGWKSWLNVDAAPKEVAAAKPERKPKFEFYNMLPEMEVVVPDSELKPAPKREVKEKAEKTADTQYLLQVGSFKKAEQADRLRASLALIGLEASVQTVAVDGAPSWHRVRLGPFKSLATLDGARARLRENEIEAIVLKIAGY